jgi:hypothetical protein
MNTWLAVAVLVGLVLIAAVVVGVRRPRHAEAELGQPKSQAVAIETPGPLKQTPLRDFLRSIQRQRETGTLQVSAGGRTGFLYFLFGHLFHAVCDTATGEVALRELLDWRDVQYAFDKKAPLPTEETIERPLDEILA